jgi:hypothetical protein
MRRDYLSLWAWRYSAARGWHWARCREVSPATAAPWLAVWKADEPGVTFQIAARAPRPMRL